MTYKFASLHNHTCFSITKGVIDPNDLISNSKDKYESIAITDADTMAGVWDGLKAARKKKINYIPGCEVNFQESIDNPNDTRLYQLVLLARNQTGYKNLLLLRKYGFDNFIVFYKKAASRIDWKLLEAHSEGLICLSGGGLGFIPQLIMNDKYDQAVIAAKRFAKIFGDDFALELQSTNLQSRPTPYNGYIDQRKINFALKKISEETGIRAVVTNPQYYLNKEDHDACDALMASGSGQPVSSGKRFRLDKADFYAKTPDGIEQYFTRHKNLWGEQFIKSLFDNTIYYAERCEFPEWIDPKFSNPSGKELPEFPIKDQEDYEDFLEWEDSSKEYHILLAERATVERMLADTPVANVIDCSSLSARLSEIDDAIKSCATLFWKDDIPDDSRYYRYKSQLGLNSLIASGKIPKEDIQYCIDQCEVEFDVFEFRGFSGYMLIVADFIEWCRKNGGIVGPGRGSVGGCLTAYLNGIHKAYPKKYGMIFSRFLNKEKAALCDIDVDIAPTFRDKLHRYLKDKYGDLCVAHVSNFSTITPKVYARDIARAFDFGNGGRTLSAQIGKEIADSVSDEIKSVKKALKEAPLFAEYAKQYPELEKFAELLDGKPKAWSTHAAGVIISKRPLHEIVPLRRDVSGALCLEVEKERAEELGLVKMDTLGLETLDIISDTYALLGRGYDADFDYEGTDEKAYQMISDGMTGCMFQLDGTAVSTCKAVKPRNESEIGIVTALIRPASKDIIPEYLKVRRGEHPLEFIHPSLENSLKLTLGFGLFEECLMQIALDLPKWTLWKADALRKMTKDKGKHPEKVEQLKAEFINDCFENSGIDKAIAETIWDTVIASFSGYGFNLSHAILYSMISYHTAYLKANHFLQFMVANLMSKVGANTPKAKDSVIKLKAEIRSRGIKIIPPDINKSENTFKIIDNDTLMSGLDALKHIGKNAIPEIVAKRPYSSIKDFMLKVDGKKVNSKTIQVLAACGAFDSFGINRRTLYLYSKDYRDKIKALHKRYTSKGFPAEYTAKVLNDFVYPFPETDSWTMSEQFAMENFYIGEGFSGTVQQRYAPFFDVCPGRISTLKNKFKYFHHSNDEKENRKANTFQIESAMPCLKALITNINIFKVKKEDSKIFGQIMARGTLQDIFGDTVDFLCFPDSLQNFQDRALSIAKTKEVTAGLVVSIRGQFQWESESSCSIIVSEVLDVKTVPNLPKYLESKKVKIPSLRITKKELEELNKEEFADALEDELILDGVTDSENEDDYSGVDIEPEEDQGHVSEED